jgi:GH25 family lysozyme M1 (1,4-beta-N-acetylmuramidase)
MSRGFSRRQTGVLAIVTALALPGGIAAILVASGGSFTSELAATVQQTATAPALAAGAPAGQAVVSPAATRPVDSARLAATAPPSAAPKIVVKPPPVVDGVRRVDVGLAHSPQIQRQLSASSLAGSPPVGAGALGIDVADYQHRNGALIDWSQVAAAGYKFAFVKATEGDYYVNPYYAYDLAQAKAAGLYVAGYHFAIPNVSDGASQADYALRNGAYTAGGRALPLALDIEYNPYGPECYGLTPAEMVSWVSSFTAEAQRLTGQLPVIYTTADWWNTCTGDSAAFGADQLWVAAFGDDSPPMPAGWSNWTFWQYTSRGSVPGVTGPVDVSYFLRAAVRLVDPGDQSDGPGTAIQLQISSLNAADGQSPQFTASGLPPGLAINGSGLITGTIAAAASGAYPVTVTAAYPSGVPGSVSFSWTVASGKPSRSPSAPPSSASAPSASPPSAPSPSAPSSSFSPPPSASAPSPSPSSASPSPSASPSSYSSPTPSPSPSPSLSPSTSPSPSPSASLSPSGSPSGSASSAPSPSSPSPSPGPSSPPAASPLSSAMLTSHRHSSRRGTL